MRQATFVCCKHFSALRHCCVSPPTLPLGATDLPTRTHLISAPLYKQFPPSPEPPWCRNPPDGRSRQDITAVSMSYSDFLHEQFADGVGKDNRRMKDARDQRKVSERGINSCSPLAWTTAMIQQFDMRMLGVMVSWRGHGFSGVIWNKKHSKSRVDLGALVPCEPTFSGNTTANVS